MKKTVFTLFALMAVAVGSMAKAPDLTYNGEVLEWNTEFDRTLAESLNPSAVIPEVSGIACSRVTPGYLWMESDEIQDYIIATDETGQTRYAKVQFPGENYLWDWEDLCGGVYNGKDYLFIGAFGDNKEVRSDYCIVWFEEPEITGEQINITPSRINYAYPDGKSHNAEALMYDNVEQTLYVITKVYYNVCQVFKLPFRTDYGSEKQTLEYVCDLGVKADLGEGDNPDKGFHLVTAADITPDGKYILIKNQNNTNAQYSWILIWEREEGESVDAALKRQPQPLRCYEVEWQGEAICWKDNNTFFTTSDSDEGERPPLYLYTRKGEPEPLVKRSFTIDGNLEEWEDLTSLTIATVGASVDEDGLHELRCYADEENLYFYLAYSAEAGKVNELSFMWEADNDPSTGYEAWMWGFGADYMLSGAPGADFAYAGLYAFDNSKEHDSWSWLDTEVSDIAIASDPVSLSNDEKAFEGKIDLKKFPQALQSINFGLYSSNTAWGESGFLPNVGESALDVPVYKETSTALEPVSHPTLTRKVLVGNQLLIIRDGKAFTITGSEVQ